MSEVLSRPGAPRGVVGRWVDVRDVPGWGGRRQAMSNSLMVFALTVTFTCSAACTLSAAKDIDKNKIAADTAKANTFLLKIGRAHV